MPPKIPKKVTRGLLIPIVFVLLSLPHHTTNFSFASEPQVVDNQLEWWEDPPEASGQLQSLPKETSQTIFEKWKINLEGVQGEVDLGKLPATPDSINSGVGAKVDGGVTLSPNSKDQSLALEFLKKTDQSTSYAKDGIGGAKNVVNERVIKPLSKGFEQGYGKTPKPTPRFPQKNTFNINKTRPSEMTFYQRNAPKVEKHLGNPKDNTGSLQVLATLNTIQHLIDCKNRGSDVRKCFKTYVINQGAAKAVFEVLSLTGLATYGAVFSIAYADYVAIKNIMKVHKVTSGMWDDYQQELRQGRDNDIADRSNWNGSLRKLEQMTELFVNRYVNIQGEIGEQLLYAWADSYDRIKLAQKARSRLEAALGRYRGQDFGGRLKGVFLKAIEETGFPLDSDKDCSSVIPEAMQRTKTTKIVEVYHPKGLVKYYRGNCKSAFNKVKEDSESALAALLEKASNPDELEELLVIYDQAENSLIRTEDHLDEYEHNDARIRGKMKNLSIFLRSRIDTIYWSNEYDKNQALGYIKTMEKRIADYKPPKMYFDTMGSYRLSIEGMRSDLTYLQEIPKKIIAERDKQLAMLAKVEKEERQKIETEGCGVVESLEKCLDQCNDLEKKYKSEQTEKKYRIARETISKIQSLQCPFAERIVLKVLVPDFIGKNTSEAKGIAEKHGLLLTFYETKTPDPKEALISTQSPGAGASVEWETNVDVGVFIYDQSASPTECVALKTRYKKYIVTGNPDFERGKDVIAKAEYLNCYWVSAGKSHMQETTVSFEKEAAEFERFCGELLQEYKLKVTSENPDFNRGEKILSQGERCDWHERAKSHYFQTKKAYETFLADQEQKQHCSDLADNYNRARKTSHQTLDLSEVKSILDSSTSCEWYGQAKQLMPCYEGQYKALKAFGRGDLANASAWTNWGKERNCSYIGRLTSLISEEETRRQKEQCQTLANKYDSAVRRANQSLDISELKSILASAESCSWYSKAIAGLPCIDGEYNAIKAINNGDLQNGSAWVNWGKTKNCGYVARLAGFINQALSKRQQNAAQKKPGLWESVGQSIVEDLEDYNKQTFEQTQRSINQSRQKKTEPRAVQQQSRSTSGKSNKQCAEMDAQILGACRLQNLRPVYHLKARFLAQGCEFSGATNACLESCVAAAHQGNPCNL